MACCVKNHLLPSHKLIWEFLSKGKKKATQSAKVLLVSIKGREVISARKRTVNPLHQAWKEQEKRQ
eukprot:scaffold156335_cov13-Tisochrysis_lutea.AAC.1